MKRFLIVLMVCMFVLSANIFGGEKDDKDLKVASISVGAGGDAISPGFTASAFFEDGRGNELKIKGSSDGMSYVAYFLKILFFRNIPIDVKIGPYTGYCRMEAIFYPEYLEYKKDPDVFNIGLYAKSSVGNFLTLFYWKGWKFADDKEQSWKIGKFLDMWGAYFSFSIFDIGYYHLNLDGEKFHVPSAYFNISINERFMLFVGADYKIRIGEKNNSTPPSRNQ